MRYVDIDAAHRTVFCSKGSLETRCIRRDLMGIRKPENGPFRIFFPDTGAGIGWPHVTFFIRFPVSGQQRPCGHPESGFWSLTGSNKMKPNISTTIEQKEFLKVLTVKLIQLDSCWVAEPQIEFQITRPRHVHCSPPPQAAAFNSAQSSRQSPMKRT
jgi:hypothetical protein